jgi:hypothetical protein
MGIVLNYIKMKWIFNTENLILVSDSENSSGKKTES